MAAASLRGIAVFLPLAISLATTSVTIVIHGLFLNAIVHYVRHQHSLGRVGVHFWTDVAIVIVAALLALLAHLASMAIWALVFVLCGEFPYLAVAFYHSAMNYTSLGLRRYCHVARVEIGRSPRNRRWDADVWRVDRNDFLP